MAASATSAVLLLAVSAQGQEGLVMEGVRRVGREGLFGWDIEGRSGRLSVRSLLCTDCLLSPGRSLKPNLQRDCSEVWPWGG